MTIKPQVAGLAVALFIGGCGEPAATPPVGVRGLVTFRGSPLPGGFVVFTPDDDYGSRGVCATGRIGPDGRFTLSTNGAAGAAAGKYLVTVAGPEGCPLPQKLLDPHLSGLRAEVVAGQENLLEFTLEAR